MLMSYTWGKISAATSILSVRVNSGERELLNAAATELRTSVSDFVRRAAVEAAEIEVSSRTRVTIPAELWEAFEAWLHRPAEDLPGLAELFRRKPTWER